MAVILPDRMLTVWKRAHSWSRDAHGTPVASVSDTITKVGPHPGAAIEPQEEEGVWNLRLDTAVWRLREGDKITDDQGNTFIVVGFPKLTVVPGSDGRVDFVRARATLDPPLVP